MKKQSSSTTFSQLKQQLAHKKDHKNSFDPSQLEEKISAMIQHSKLLGGKIHSRKSTDQKKFQLNIASLSRNPSKDDIATSRPASDMKKPKTKSGNQSDRGHYYDRNRKNDKKSDQCQFISLLQRFDSYLDKKKQQ